jgi:hypothetical protein
MVNADRSRSEIRNGYLAALIVLVAQFLLGMAVNLFVVIPRQHPGANPPEYFGGVVSSVTWAILQQGQFWLVVHASLGLILVLVGAGLLARAIRSGNRARIIVASVGALAILAAGFNGGSYLNYHEDFSSMLMASFFAIAVVAYAVGIYLAAPRSA